MLYPVISLINRSPDLLPMDLTITQRILGAKLDWRINLDGKGEKLFLIWIGVSFLMITPILRICMPKNAHTRMILHIMCVQIFFLKKKKKKKKRSTYRPSQFSGQKGKQTFLFIFRPNNFRTRIVNWLNFQACFTSELNQTWLTSWLLEWLNDFLFSGLLLQLK